MVEENLTTNALLTSWRERRDRQSLDRLVETFIPITKVWARKVFSGSYKRGNYDLDDAIQDGCIGLLKAFDHYKSENGAFVTYAYEIVKNAILDGLRNAKAFFRRKNDQGFYAKRCPEFDYDADNSEREDVIHSDGGFVDYCLSGLPQREAEVWRLIVNDVPQKDIAVKLGCAKSYVSMVKSGALKKLKKRFSKPELRDDLLEVFAA